ncbi:phosphoribosyl-ATP diphosphatase [Candidatus Vidania fulgoroideorum]
MIKNLIKKIKKSIKTKNKNNYSNYLIKNKEILIRKISEECMEFIIEIFKNKKKRMISEFCDLLYHITVVLVKYKLPYKKVKKKLLKPN